MKHFSFAVILLSALVVANAAIADVCSCQPHNNSDARNNLRGGPVCQQKYSDEIWQHFNLDSGDLKGGFRYVDPFEFNRPSAKTFKPTCSLEDWTVSNSGNASSCAGHALRRVHAYAVSDSDELDGSCGRGVARADIGLQDGRWAARFPVFSFEFGGAHVFADSSQDEFSLIRNYTINPRMSVRFAVFDLDGGGASGGLAALDEPRLVNNVFIRWQGQGLWSTGLYASLGVEQLFTTHGIGTRPLWRAGIGLKRNSFDVSIESVYLDRAVLATAADLQYQVLELKVRPGERWSAYLELVRSVELRSASQRLGANYALRSALGLNAEISKESNAPAGKGRSMDVRLTFRL